MLQFNQRPDPGVSSLSAYKRGPSDDRNSTVSALRNPTLSTSTISLQTNTTTSLPFLIRPWSDGWHQKFTEGSILFCNKGGTDSRMTTAVDIPSMNYLCQQAVSLLPNAKKGDNDLYPDPNKSYNNANFKYGFLGVIRNDLLADSTLQKLYNVDVFGRSMIGNIFSDQQMKRGDLVGLAIVKMDVHKNYNYFYRPEGTTMPASITKNLAYQVVGTCNGLICGHHDKKHKLNHVGKAFIIKEVVYTFTLGTISHAVARVPGLGQIKEALRNQDRFGLLPRVEVLLNN